MKPLLVAAVYGLLPCDSYYATEPAFNMTIVYRCPNTFGELAGPFLTEGWKPSPAPLPMASATGQVAASNSDNPTVQKATSKKKKKKRRRRS